MPAAVVATRSGTGRLRALKEGEKAEWLVEGPREGAGKVMVLFLQLVRGSLSVIGAGKPKNGRFSGSLSFSLQMLHLAMQVLLLRRGLQQILAGDLTRGGLLSFLLYREDVGDHVQVSQELCTLSFPALASICSP